MHVTVNKDFLLQCIAPYFYLLLFILRYHESWNLPSPPHIVTYAKKMLSGGLFAREGMLPDQVRVVYLLCLLMKKQDLHGQDGLLFYNKTSIGRTHQTKEPIKRAYTIMMIIGG